MWTFKVWRFSPYGIDAARERMNRWIEIHQHEYQIVEVFVNNAFGVEYKELRTI